MLAEILGVHNLHQTMDSVLDHVLPCKGIIIACLQLSDLPQRQMNLRHSFAYLEPLEVALRLVLVARCVERVKLLEHEVVRPDLLLLQEF